CQGNLFTGSLVHRPEQLVHARLRTRLFIDLLDDNGAVEAVLPVLRRQISGYDHRSRRHSTIQHLAGFPIVDTRALADVDAHCDDAAALDDDAFDDLRARPDETVVLDDR